MSDDQQPATGGTENEIEQARSVRLPRRRLLQALGGAAGLASAGLPQGPVGRGRAQSHGGQWSQQQKLIPTDGGEDDRFANTASVSGDGTTAVIGAGGDEDPNGPFAGSAYVFRQGAQQGPVDQYDGDGDGQIDNRELLDALADYDGDAPREEDSVNNQELLELLAAYSPTG